MSEPLQVVVVHPALSTKFHGVTRSFFDTGGADVWQFRGIKFGTILGRFQQGIMNETYKPDHDSVAFGRKCPQVVVHPSLEEALIGTPPKHVPVNLERLYDEFECLNLNITTPIGAHEGNDFPVMVYIHGGGGFSGSNSDWWCDGGGLASRSVTLEKPIVVVSINYRLSALGHLGAAELRKVNGADNGGNYAFHDMHLGLEWIHKHIGPFGGSCSDITIYGESFGSIGVQTLMHSDLEPRFSKCILQSQILGAPLFGNPETIATKSAVYEKVKANLGVTTVQQLQLVPWQDLLKAFASSDPRAGLPHVPMIDDIVLSENWKNNYNFARARSGSVLVGNTGYEASVIEAVLAVVSKPATPPSTKDLLASIRSVVSAEKVDPMLSQYQIFETVPLAAIRSNLLSLIEDIAWYQPTAELVTLLETPHPARTTVVHQYTFQQLNPFKGAFEGKANHALDLAYLHGEPQIFEQTTNESSEMKFSDAVKGYWIWFADGEPVWDSKQMMEFGPGGVDSPGDLATFMEEKRHSGRWGALDFLSFSDKEAVASIILGHLAQLNGV